jgi:hypothetical protein
MKVKQTFYDDEVKGYIDVKEFYELGLIQEINRLILHPMGMALSVTVYDDGEVKMSDILDFRGDPEGIIFADPDVDMVKKAKRVEVLFNKKKKQRMKKLGYHVQPVPRVSKNKK